MHDDSLKRTTGVDRLVAGGAGFTAGLALRGGALRWGWSLPAFGKG